MNKASGLLGMTVRSPEKAKLGRVDDIVFDTKSARVAYVVMGSGGVLGIAEKKVAVPLSAYTTNPETSTLVLNTTKDRLQMAQGLKSGHWPSINHPSWGAERFWDSSDNRARPAIDQEKPNENPGRASLDQQRPNESHGKHATDLSVNDVDRATADTAAAGRDLEPAKINRASYVFGMTVKDPKGERLGKISDVVFDLNSDRVAYTVLSTETAGGVMLNRKLIAVPIDAYIAIPTSDSLVLNTTKDKLDAAQGFSDEKWPSVTNPDFGSQPIWQHSASRPSTDVPKAQKSDNKDEQRRTDQDKNQTPQKDQQ
jgi:sporulation protein YlmC with PRC-barrel domain